MEAPAPRLDRPRIVAAAGRIADAEGLEAVTTRRLASDLGVTPMALYRHVSGKDDILEGVVDSLLLDLPLPDDAEWRSVLRDLAAGLRGMLREHPVAVELFLRRPVTTEQARVRLRVALDALAAAGFDDDDACRAYAAVHSYTVGYSALEAARGRAQAPDETAAEADPLATAIRSFVSDGQFEHGLGALIDGLGP